MNRGPRHGRKGAGWASAELTIISTICVAVSRGSLQASVSNRKVVVEKLCLLHSKLERQNYYFQKAGNKIGERSDLRLLSSIHANTYPIMQLLSANEKAVC